MAFWLMAWIAYRMRFQTTFRQSLKRPLSNFWQGAEPVAFHCKTLSCAHVEDCHKTIIRRVEGSQPQSLDMEVETIIAASGIEASKGPFERHTTKSAVLPA
jgi:hypothetical protein